MRAPLFPLVVITAVLFLARDILIPVALAILLSFILSPLSARLEKRLPVRRAVAVGIAVSVAAAVVGGTGWILFSELEDLATSLPEYRSNLRRRVADLREGQAHIERFAGVLQRFEETLAPPPESAVSTFKAPPPPTRVEIVAPHEGLWSGLWRTFAGIASPVAGIFISLAIVAVFSVVMLLNKEDVRDRFLLLGGPKRVNLTREALDEAGTRVSRYLITQLCLNASYGTLVGLGLFAAGIPSAAAWGILVTLLRFIPFIGFWIASIPPIVLSFAVSSGWGTPLAVIALYAAVEALMDNLLEPWFYGSATGLSSVAILSAALFWSWLWGPMGLVLATPLSVCLAVLGRHVPRLEFLHILLSDERTLIVEGMKRPLERNKDAELELGVP